MPGLDIFRSTFYENQAVTALNILVWLLSTPAHCLLFRTRTATAPALRHYENMLFKCLFNLEKFEKIFEIFFSIFFEVVNI